MDDGVIKYKIHWKEEDVVSRDEIKELNELRQKLFERGLIGTYPDGTGYGNISIRRNLEPGMFIITGTQTALLPKLSHLHYSLVRNCNILENELYCEGMVKASSEALSHASIYQTSNQANAIIHVHSQKLWDKLLQAYPYAAKEVPYGTPQMAFEIQRLFQEEQLDKNKRLAMAGHPEGIFCFGENVQEALKILDEIEKM